MCHTNFHLWSQYNINVLNKVLIMLLLQVVGYKLTGVVDTYATSTDVVLTITKVKMYYNLSKPFLHVDMQ